MSQEGPPDPLTRERSGPRLFTVGHSRLDAEELAGVLTSAGIARVVDVRRHPGSRRHPHFAKDAMAGWLAAAGVGYRWADALGGRRSAAEDSPHVALRNAGFRGYADHMDTEEFRAALDELLAEAARQRTAVMCAESLWWRCHRRLLADAAVLLRGAEVIHLHLDGSTQPHPATAEARVVDDALVYDAGETEPGS